MDKYYLHNIFNYVGNLSKFRYYFTTSALKGQRFIFICSKNKIGHDVVH